jgi:hypothetical protein
MEGSYVEHRRAIEALRAGVPNRDAVLALGSTQPRIVERFARQLESALDDVPNETQTAGLLIEGDFGTGKSHLLEYLQHRALDQRFVCSKIVISKETPLYDPTKLYRAAVEMARLPGRQGAALTEVAFSLQFDSRDYAQLTGWVHGADGGLDARFAATLFLFERVPDEEVRDRIISFWSGDPLNINELRRWLRDLGEAASYKLEPITARELTLQRFRFAARLMIAAGYSGWVLLVDEVELIGRYSFKQRARSYAELARWAGRLEKESYPGISAVFALTSDFSSFVLEGRNDIERIPGRLRATELEADALLARQAERGMRLIARDALRLRPPDRPTIERSYEQVRAIHAQAYGWDPPPLDQRARTYGVSTSMRQYVRQWITAWDLRRLDPAYAAETVTSEVQMDYSEDPTLEGQTDASTDDGI